MRSSRRSAAPRPEDPDRSGTTTERVFLGLGANLDSPRVQLRAAAAGLRQAGVAVVAASPIYLTEPVGGPGQPPYLNQVLEIRTSLPPAELLAVCRALERARGRRRRRRDAARELDVDLLLYGARIVDRPGLTLPHPRLHARRFVLVPLRRLAPELVHPRLGRTIAGLTSTCRDRSWIRELGR